MRASSTRTDMENARRPVRPVGCGGTRPLSLLRLLDDAGIAFVADASKSSASRSLQLIRYFGINRLGLYAYDAYLVVLARTQRLPLLTLDQRLGAAAAGAQVALLEFR